MKRAALACLLLLVCGVVAAFSGANFTSASKNPGNSLSAGTVGIVSNFTASASGQDVALTWTAASNAASYVVRGGTSSSSSCTGVTYTQVGTTSTTSYTDSGRSSPAGTYYCYSVQSVFHSFTNLAASPVGSAQLGVVASAATLTDGADTSGCSGRNGSGYLDCGDRIVVDFNQPMNTAQGPSSGDKVCGANGNSVIMLGYSSSTCALGQYPTLGALYGVSTTNSARYAATWTWSNGNRRLTIDIDARDSGASNVRLGSGTWTFQPAPGLTSATGAAPLCLSNSSGASCTPAATGTL